MGVEQHCTCLILGHMSASPTVKIVFHDKEINSRILSERRAYLQSPTQAPEGNLREKKAFLPSGCNRSKAFLSSAKSSVFLCASRQRSKIISSCFASLCSHVTASFDVSSDNPSFRVKGLRLNMAFSTPKSRLT